MRLNDTFWRKLLLLPWLTLWATLIWMSAAGAAETKPTKPKVPGVVVERSRVFDPEKDGDPVINNLQRRTFRFFWDTSNKQTGMAPDRFPSPSFASTAAIGFALTAYVVRSGRGYVSHAQARPRTPRTLAVT